MVLVHEWWFTRRGRRLRRLRRHQNAAVDSGSVALIRLAVFPEALAGWRQHCSLGRRHAEHPVGRRRRLDATRVLRDLKAWAEAVEQGAALVRRPPRQRDAAGTGSSAKGQRWGANIRGGREWAWRCSLRAGLCEYHRVARRSVDLGDRSVLGAGGSGLGILRTPRRSGDGHAGRQLQFGFMRAADDALHRAARLDL